jgi:toxin ParE1/3/4
MANKYRLSNRAVDDLAEIWNYTFDTWSESQADKYYGLILMHCQEIADGLIVGKCYPEILEDLLGSLIGRHIVFYRFSKDKTVEIVRILHSRMDLRNRIET